MASCTCFVIESEKEEAWYSGKLSCKKLTHKKTHILPPTEADSWSKAKSQSRDLDQKFGDRETVVNEA